MQMFPLMRTFAIIGILLVNVYSTKKYLVEVGNERSEEDEASGRSEEEEYEYQSYAEWSEHSKELIREWSKHIGDNSNWRG